MSVKVLIAGAAMVPFLPLGGSDSHAALAGQAIRAALADARIDYDLVDQVFTSCVHAEAGIAEQMLSQIGYSGCRLSASAMAVRRPVVLSIWPAIACCAARLNVSCWWVSSACRHTSPIVSFSV